MKNVIILSIVSVLVLAGMANSATTVSYKVAASSDDGYACGATATDPNTVSGYVRGTDGNAVEDVALSADNGIETVFTDSTGFYELGVPYSWSGAVTPSKFP